MNIFKNKLPCSIALILIITVILSAFLPMVAYAETDSSKAYEIANEISSDTKTTEMLPCQMRKQDIKHI